MKKLKLLKLLAAATAFLIIGFMFMLVNSFTGNPISAAIATSKIKAYVKTAYSDLNLKVPKAVYNFKDSSYYSKVKSESSEDTTFMISWNNRGIQDSYEYEVANNYTTYRRLSEELDKLVESIIKKEFPYETDIVIADLGKRDEDFKKLTLDMPFDVSNLPMDATLTLYTFSDTLNYEILSQRLKEAANLMDKHNIPITYYSITLEEPFDKQKTSGNQSLYLNDYPASEIHGDDLIDKIKNHQTLLEEKWNKEKDAEMSPKK